MTARLTTDDIDALSSRANIDYGTDQVHRLIVVSLVPELERILDERIAEAKTKNAADQRWDTAVDWLLNHRAVAIGYTPLFFAFCDGLITEQELRDESVHLDEIDRRRKQAEGSDG